MNFNVVEDKLCFKKKLKLTLYEQQANEIIKHAYNEIFLN